MCKVFEWCSVASKCDRKPQACRATAPHHLNDQNNTHLGVVERCAGVEGRGSPVVKRLVDSHLRPPPRARPENIEPAPTREARGDKWCEQRSSRTSRRRDTAGGGGIGREYQKLKTPNVERDRYTLLDVLQVLTTHGHRDHSQTTSPSHTRPLQHQQQQR